MRETGVPGIPEIVRVTTDAEAALGFRGSPSVTVDGVDVDENMTGDPGLHWG